MRHNKSVISIVLVSCLFLVACKKELQPVEVIIKDPVRHYFPVIQGETMGVTYEIENISKTPLFIQEVQTTCGCLVSHDALPIIILPNKKGFVHLDFNTIKNTGYVCHYIYCYGNFKDTPYIELQFDTNIVPQADYIRDYEQLWHDQLVSKGLEHDFTDGKSAQKGYFTDNGPDDRQKLNDEVNEQIDSNAL